MARSKTSRSWLNEHFKDPYVQRSWKEGLRSRAAYKLIEMQDKDRLIKPGMTVIDLGAAPGGWTQVVSEIIGSKGRIIAMDVLAMDPFADVQFIQGDFTEDSVFQALLEALEGDAVDVVLSDMAPNMSGNRSVDQARSMYLCELAVDFAAQVLKPGGCLLMKIFQGEGFEPLLHEVRQHYDKVITRKPDASRDRSREVYWLCQGFKHH
jgi:23S rRNA (uridine2552-2'-O)-methyltransferase